MMKTNAINWFEIYVNDFARACRFYEAILDCKLETTVYGPCQMGMFPCNYEKGIGGALVKMDLVECGGKPGGTMVYLNVEGELDRVIERIPAAGGKIIKERMAIPPHGFIALFQDSEGNINGLHSMS
jgi:predicted enzyme related to lactoylglutathione lyase